MKRKIIIFKRIAGIILSFIFLGVVLSSAFAIYKGETEKGGSTEESLPPLLSATPNISSEAILLENNDTTTEYAPGQLIVKFKPEAAAADNLKAYLDFQQRQGPRAALSSELDIPLVQLSQQNNLSEIESVFKEIKNTEDIKQRFPQRTKRAPKDAVVPDLSNIHILKFPEDSNILALAEEYNNLPEVEYAEPNYLNFALATLGYKALHEVDYTEPKDTEPKSTANALFVPNDPYYHSSNSWGQGYDDLWGIKKIGCEQAWDISQGQDIVVAVIDSGIDYTHEDLAANMWVNQGEIPNNGIDDDGNGFIDDYYGFDFAYNDLDPMDVYGHGTHCAGTIAAVGNNNKGVIGVAPLVKLMALKGLDDGGGGHSSDLAAGLIYAADMGADVLSNSWGYRSPNPVSQVVSEAVDYAHALGCVTVAAAGNANDDVGTPESGYGICTLKKVITTSASNQDDKKCSFSNYGGKIDVAAPGGDYRNILSTMKNETAMVQSHPELLVSDGYYRLSGTSMACPHVSGVSALLLSYHPEFSNEQVRQAIRMTADDTETAGWDINSGYGRVSAYKAVQISSRPGVALLTSPIATVSGTISIEGSAYGDNFKEYSLYYGEGRDPDTWTRIFTSTTSVDSGTLYANFDTFILRDEIVYTARLIVKDVDNNMLAEDRTYIIANNINIDAPLNNDIYRLGDIIEINGAVVAESFFDFTATVAYATSLDPNTWIPSSNGPVNVTNGNIFTTFDTSLLAESEYITIKLTVERNDGVYSEEFIKDIYIDSTLKQGWPARIPWADAWPGRFVSVPSDINNDGRKEIIVYIAGIPAKVYVFNSNGEILNGWPVDIGGDSWTPISAIHVPVISDLNGDSSKEILVVKYPKIYAFKYNGEILEGWPIEISLPGTNAVVNYGTVLIKDLDWDGQHEVIIQENNSPEVDTGIIVLDSQGTILSRWVVDGKKLAVGNIDNDREWEIIVTSDYSLHVFNMDGSSVSGWPISIDVKFTSLPTVGDINNDGSDEILISTIKGVYAFDKFGSILPGWPFIPDEYIKLDQFCMSSIALADFDSDGDLEIAVSSCGAQQHYTWVLHYDGTPALGWPQLANWRNYSSCVVGDINNDAVPDIIAPIGHGFWPTLTSHGGIYAWNYDGTLIEGFPKVTQAGIATPAIADIDNDGKVELIASIENDYDFIRQKIKKRSSVYVWKLDSYEHLSTVQWPQYRHDEKGTGNYRGLMSCSSDPCEWHACHPEDCDCSATPCQIFDKYTDNPNHNPCISECNSCVSNCESIAEETAIADCDSEAIQECRYKVRSECYEWARDPWQCDYIGNYNRCSEKCKTVGTQVAPLSFLHKPRYFFSNATLESYEGSFVLAKTAPSPGKDCFEKCMKPTTNCINNFVKDCEYWCDTVQFEGGDSCSIYSPCYSGCHGDDSHRMIGVFKDCITHYSKDPDDQWGTHGFTGRSYCVYFSMNNPYGLGVSDEYKACLADCGRY